MKSVLGVLGLEGCDAQPSLFYSKTTTDVAVKVHVDDLDTAGPDDAVNDLLNEAAKVFLMKIGDPVGPSCRS